MTEEIFECEECGENFDSKRGLHVHEGQVHENKEDGQEEDVNTISLRVSHLMAGVFVLGLAIGFAGGLTAANFDTGVSSSIDTDENTNSQETSDSPNESPTEVMASIASNLNINGDALKQYIDSSSGEEIQKDKSEIQQIAGSLGTPTFFIGNSEIGYTEISGAQPYPQMKTTIDQKISEAENSDSNIGEDEYTLENISFEDEPALGERSASINIIEYSDFGCPWCAEWHGVDAIPNRPIDEENSFQKVRDNYIETGEVRFIMKDYPVPRLHPEAMTAHKAANYVWENQPDRYWGFIQSIYEERDRW